MFYARDVKPAFFGRGWNAGGIAGAVGHGARFALMLN